MKYIVLVVLAAVLWGTTGTAQALAGVDASPLAVGAARIVIGGGLLGVLALVLFARDRSVAPVTPATRTGVITTIALGAIGVLGYQPTFFYGTSTNGVAVGTIVALGSGPLFTGVIEWVITRQAPARRWLIATGIALIGLVLLTGVGGSLDPLGLLASLGAGLCYAIYAIATKTLLNHGWRPELATGSLFGVAGVLSLPVLIAAGTGWMVTPEGIALVLWLGVITTTLSYVLYPMGLRGMRASTASTLTLAEPITAALLGLFVLGEQLTPVGTIGVIVIGIGLAVLMVPGRSARGPAPVSS